MNNTVSTNNMIDDKENNIDKKQNTISSTTKTHNIEQYRKDYFNSKKEYFSEKLICSDCGGLYARSNKNNHIKTKKHVKSVQIKKVHADVGTFIVEADQKHVKNESVKKDFSDIVAFITEADNVLKNTTSFVITIDRTSSTTKKVEKASYEVKITPLE